MLQRHADCRIYNFDKLTYAGNIENLAGLEGEKRHHLVRGDICDPESVSGVLKLGIDAVINFAAESHVDRSIQDASEFVQTNIQGTQNLMEVSRRHKVKRFVQISTDEVYGSLGSTGYFTETTPLAPNSPYAASKAAADLLVRSYHHTYGFPAVITRCSNNYGPYQFPEKLIPLIICQSLSGKPLPVYGSGRNV